MEHFREVQRLKIQLDQYTDLTDGNRKAIEQVLPRDNLLGFRGAYLETAQRLRAQQGKGAETPSQDADQLDFEFVLFASAVIDYDYIMGLDPASRPAVRLSGAGSGCDTPPPCP
ncbi:type I restriction endonuclease subunit R, EcoR124 family [Brevundimonas diminuta]